jgi:hypothetical protein
MVFKPKKKEVEEFEEEAPVPQYEKQRVNRQPVQEEQEELWSVGEIPTATQPVIYNARTKKTYTLYEAIAEILNRSE